MTHIYPTDDMIANDEDVKEAIEKGELIVTENDEVKVTGYYYKDKMYITDVDHKVKK